MTGIPKMTTPLDYFDQRKDIKMCGEKIQEVIEHQDAVLQDQSSIIMNAFGVRELNILYDSITDNLSRKTLIERINSVENVVGIVFNNCMKSIAGGREVGS